MDILDKEASDDEAARRDGPFDRPPSHESNRELVEQAEQYRRILGEASQSDKVVRDKWDEWEANISELTLDEVSRSEVNF
jgi:programmed cell death 6-interacting protein